MMTTFTVSIIIVLLCNCISADNTILSRAADSISSSVISCVDANDCPAPEYCAVCDEGFEPDCDQPICVNGKCEVIPRCSQIRSSTTTSTPPTNICMGTDTSFCAVDFLCAHCPEGYSPGCNEPVCINDECKTIPACSIYTPTNFTTSTTTDPSTLSYECQDDSQCLYPAPCAAQCETGFGPLCGLATCVDGKCAITAPCSQETSCTNSDLSQCATPQICAECLEGYSPGCAQAACVDGQCTTIMPCSIFDGSQTTIPSTIPSTDVCTRSSQCPRSKLCKDKCAKGTTPRCASAKCVDGQCIPIKPCSQHTCKTRATCPYKKNNCGKCVKGYGPPCEQATCKCGICSIIPPCSKKTKSRCY